MFRAREAIEFAMRMEKNGQAFYEAMAQASQTAPVRDLFQRLAREEKKHREEFSQMLERAGSYEAQESYPGEYEQYLRALIDTQVFGSKGQPQELAAQIGSEAEGIRLALQSEKDSILFYQSLRSLVPEGEWQFVDQLIAQERRHVCDLSIQLELMVP